MDDSLGEVVQKAEQAEAAQAALKICTQELEAAQRGNIRTVEDLRKSQIKMKMLEEIASKSKQQISDLLAERNKRGTLLTGRAETIQELSVALARRGKLVTSKAEAASQLREEAEASRVKLASMQEETKITTQELRNQVKQMEEQSRDMAKEKAQMEEIALKAR